MEDEMMKYKKNALLGNISTEPLCQAYKQAWRSCGDDKGMLVRLAMKQQSIPHFSTACYKKLGLTKEYIKDNFRDYINGYVLEDCDGIKGYTYALYVDWGYDNDLDIKTDVSSIMWCIDTNIIVPKCKCPTIYISNSSRVRLICNGYNTVNVKLFDDSKIALDDIDEESNVTIFKYSEKATVELGKFCLKEPKVFNKELRL
jgi:hypothetical protein